MRWSIAACAAALAAGLALPLPCLAAKPKAHPPAAQNGAGGRMDFVPWFSLEQAPGQAEARLGMKAEAPLPPPGPHGENITVLGTRRAPVPSELVRRPDGSQGAEAWQSDAAQPVMPRMGEGCSYRWGCFDANQKPLLSMIPGM